MKNNVSLLKAPSLRKCRNKKCNCYYYGYKHRRYCSDECAKIAEYAQSMEYQKEWRKDNIDYVRSYHRNRYHNTPITIEEYRQNIK